jgi:hypothetical protein
MNGKIVVRLFYAPACSEGCCTCGPNQDMTDFGKVAEKLVKKFGEEHLVFEAYNSIDLKKFPFLRGASKPSGKIAMPLVSIDEKILTQGKVPTVCELEEKVRKRLKEV